jgi:hypothetical protein
MIQVMKFSFSNVWSLRETRGKEAKRVKQGGCDIPDARENAKWMSRV